MTMTLDRAKARAKTLRHALADMDHAISHAQSLELMAKLEGLADWNVLSARLAPEVAIGPLPKGWTRAGDQPEAFEMGRALRDATSVVAIRLKPGEAAGAAFGTLMQSVDATSYRGKRIALRGRLAADEVTGGVTQWLRADDSAKRMVAFDNLEEAPLGHGPLNGTCDWVERVIVLDIPEAALTLNFGFYLRGGGTAWCGGFELVEVGPETELTSVREYPASEPQNMTFS